MQGQGGISLNGLGAMTPHSLWRNKPSKIYIENRVQQYFDEPLDDTQSSSTL